VTANRNQKVTALPQNAVLEIMVGNGESTALICVPIHVPTEMKLVSNEHYTQEGMTNSSTG
jgi:hypothetical protein